MQHDFETVVRRDARRARHVGAIGVCPGHNGYPCLGVIVHESPPGTTGVTVVLEQHYDNSPETQRRMDEVCDILLEMLGYPRRPKPWQILWR